MKHVLPLLAIVFLALGPAWSASAAASVTNRPVIIFDTDMGSDVDDAGALALLHRLADLGEAELAGVIFSSGKNRFGVGDCDAINTWYGRGNLPLGQYQPDDVGDPQNSYSRQIATATNVYHHRFQTLSRVAYDLPERTGGSDRGFDGPTAEPRPVNAAQNSTHSPHHEYFIGGVKDAGQLVFWSAIAFHPSLVRHARGV